MFGTFFHPRSAARQREVAELSVRIAAQARAEEQALIALSGECPPVPVREEPIEFCVRYRFGECLDFVLPELARALARQRRSKGKPLRRLWPIERALVALVVWPIFAYKSWRVGVCSFRIDAQGIERLARSGRLFKPWADITLLRREKVGWVLGADKGAMPLPLRCMDAAQTARLAMWAARRRAALGE